jgi:SAM-dependent methyltransferase
MPNKQLKSVVKESIRFVLRRRPVTEFLTQLNLLRNASKPSRMLEIGPGPSRIQGFETLNVYGDLHVDYVRDAAERLPFPDETFDLIYASHILEHVPWYRTEKTLREWHRILRHRGVLEVWVPNGLQMCQALVDAELHGQNYIDKDGWYKYNPTKDPCLWAAGRCYSYGDGSGRPNHPNWHRALFTPRYLETCFRNAGLINVRQLDRSEVRAYDHGWINLGMRGEKS